jgi:hypothetical protein
LCAGYVINEKKIKAHTVKLKGGEMRRLFFVKFSHGKLFYYIQ